MPRKARIRRKDTPPSPIPSIHTTPALESEDDLTPPPKLPTPPVLKNPDLLHQILAHLDTNSLSNCFRVSTRWYDVTGPLLYRQVSLKSSASVLRLINESKPKTVTRRHTKKSFSSIPFLENTVALTLDFRSDTDMPPNWMTDLKSIFPNVRWVIIETVTRHHNCCYRFAKCFKTMWDLLAVLKPAQLSIQPRFEIDDHLRLLKACNLHKDIDTISITLPTRCGYQLDFQVYPLIQAFSNIRFILSSDWSHPPSRAAFTAQGYYGGESALKAYFDRSIPNIEGYASYIYSMVKRVNNPPPLTSTESTCGASAPKPKKVWEIYMLSSFWPRESDYWPEALVDKYDSANPPSVEKMINAMLEKDKLDDKNELIFKSRAQYLREPTRYEDGVGSKDALWKLEDARSDTDQYKALHGTWELAPKWPAVEKVDEVVKEEVEEA